MQNQGSVEVPPPGCCLSTQACRAPPDVGTATSLHGETEAQSGNRPAPQVFLGTKAWAPQPRQAEPADSSPLGAPTTTLLPRCHDNRLIIPHRPSGRVDTVSGVSQLRLPGAPDWTVLAWAGGFALLQHRPRACRALGPLSPHCWGSGPRSCPTPCGPVWCPPLFRPAWGLPQSLGS